MSLLGAVERVGQTLNLAAVNLGNVRMDVGQCLGCARKALLQRARLGAAYDVAR